MSANTKAVFTLGALFFFRLSAFWGGAFSADVCEVVSNSTRACSSSTVADQEYAVLNLRLSVNVWPSFFKSRKTNQLAVFDCGVVAHCNTSLCVGEPQAGHTYPCRLIYKGLYQLQSETPLVSRILSPVCLITGLALLYSTY